MELRSAIDVAKRALVMATVAVRASLEADDNPGSPDIAEKLPHWLEKHGLSASLDPSERDILHAPYGQLDEKDRIDAYWSGECAAVFGWMLGVCEKPPRFEKADHGAAMGQLKVLRREAKDILDNAVLRPEEELVAYCKEVRLTRNVLREVHVRGTDLDAATQNEAILLGRKLLMTELADCGVEIAHDDFEEARDIVARTTREERQRATGAYIARDVAVTWLIDGRSKYFDND